MAEKKETKKTTAKKPAAKKKTTAPKAPKVKIDVPADDIDAQETIQNAPESLQKPSKYKVVCETKPVLNVRDGAGKAYKVIRQIPNGSSVSVYEQANGFGRIGDGEWVMMAFLK